MSRRQRSRGPLAVLGDRRTAKRAEQANRLAELGLGEDGGQPAQTADLLRRAIKLSDDPPSKWKVALAEALVSGDAPAPEVDAAYCEAIHGQPNRAGLVEAWAQLLRTRGADDVDEQLINLQRSTAVPLTGVLLRVLGGPNADRARHELAEPIAAFLAGTSVAVCRQVWDDYCQLRPLDQKAGKAMRRLPTVVLRLYFLLQPVRILSLEEAEADEFGLSADALRWYAEEFLSPDHPDGWPARQFVTDWAQDMTELNDPRLAFQTRMVRERRLVLRDPYSGVDVAPFDAVMPFGRTAYSFGDRELTLLISGGEGNKAGVLLLPRHNAMIDLGARLWHYLTPTRIANLRAELLRRVATHSTEYAAAVAVRPDPRTERSVVLMLNIVENPAHHLWNSYPGVEKIIDSGLVSHVDEIRTAGSEFYGPFIDLFPEFAETTVVHEERQGVRDPYPFSPRHLIVKPGGYFIRRSLVERVVNRMAELPATSSTVPPPPELLPFPVVWIGLRVGSRSWVDQEHEVPRLIDAVHREHPDALVLLDGFSYPVGRDEISAKWESSIREIHALSAKIRESSAHPERVVDMVGNTLRESVLWAAATDVYLTPNGSSQHKVGWLTDGPGISYCSPGVAKLERERRPGSFESEGRPVPVTVIGTPESAGELRYATDKRFNIENIRLDLDEVILTLLGLIEERRLSRRT